VAYRRLSMRRIREILRLKHETGLSGRAIARAIGVSNSTVAGVFARAELAGLTWPLPEGTSDSELEERLYREHYQAVADPREPDWAQVHEELRRHKHLTLRLVWTEYRRDHPDGYGYSWFAERYRSWRDRIDVVMRQHHRAGEKLFVDYAVNTYKVDTTRIYMGGHSQGSGGIALLHQSGDQRPNRTRVFNFA